MHLEEMLILTVVEVEQVIWPWVYSVFLAAASHAQGTPLTGCLDSLTLLSAGATVVRFKHKCIGL